MNGWDDENLWEGGLNTHALPEGFPYHRFRQLGLACLARSFGTWFHLGHRFGCVVWVHVNCLVVLAVVQLLLFRVVHLQLCACETFAAVVLGAEIRPETVSVVVLGVEIHPPARWSVKRAPMGRSPLEGQRDVHKDW